MLSEILAPLNWVVGKAGTLAWI